MESKILKLSAILIALVFIESVFVFAASGQAPEVEWNKTFGGSGRDEGHSVQQTSDGGYIITGYARSDRTGDRDVLLVKTDPNGSEEWSKTFGGSEDDYGDSAQQTSDGGYIITGCTESYGAGDDVLLIKTDSNGKKQWSKTFGKSDWHDDAGHSVQQTSGGGYIVVGSTESYSAGRSDVWLIKTDSNGSEEWDKTFGGSRDDVGNSVQQTSDEGYVIAGSYSAGHYDIWLIKTDPQGNKEWEETFGGPDYDKSYSVQQTSNGGYIVVGGTKSYGAGFYDVYLIKTDSTGNKEWDKTFGGPDYDHGRSVQQTSDGGYVIAGETTTCDPQMERRPWLIKIDSTGNKEWDRIFGRSNLDGCSSGQQTSDGGYIIVGYTSGTGSYDIWLIKTDSNGSKEWDKTFDVSEPRGILGILSYSHGDEGHSVQQTSDGGYIIVGETRRQASYSVGPADLWLIKVKGE